MSHSLFYHQDCHKGQICKFRVLVPTAPALRPPKGSRPSVLSSVQALGPVTFLMSLSPCPPGTLHSLYLCGPCLSKPLPRTSAPIQLTHLSRAGVNQSWGLVEPAGSPHSYQALTTHPTRSSITGIRQGQSQTQALPAVKQRSKR